MFSSQKYLLGSIEDTVTIKNAYMITWQSKIKLCIEGQSLVSKIVDSSLLALSKLPESQSKKLLDIGAADFPWGKQPACFSFQIRRYWSGCIGLKLYQVVLQMRHRGCLLHPGLNFLDLYRDYNSNRWNSDSNVLGDSFRQYPEQHKNFFYEQEKARKLAFTLESAKKDPATVRIKEKSQKESCSM